MERIVNPSVAAADQYLKELEVLREENQSLMVRAQELQAENNALNDQLAAATKLYKGLQAALADAEDQAQALKQELDHIQSTNEWLRRELDVAYAKIEMVELIFGANHCGGCH